MPARLALIAASGAAGLSLILAGPLAAAEPAPGGASGETSTLDMASWRDMQCLSMLYMSLTDPENAANEELKGALQLVIGYHLGQLNVRAPQVAPSDLILSAINRTFTSEGIPADVKSYCQTAAQAVNKEGVAVEAVIDAAIKKAESAQGEPAASSGSR